MLLEIVLPRNHFRLRTLEIIYKATMHQGDASQNLYLEWLLFLQFAPWRVEVSASWGHLCILRVDGFPFQHQVITAWELDYLVFCILYPVKG